MAKEGTFSANLLSLEMQLKTLLEEVGGSSALEFLDEVANLHPSEQKTALKLFTKIVQKFSAGEMRFPTDGDLALKKFEEDLYNDLIKEFEKKNSQTLHLVKDLEDAKTSDPIDFQAARKSRLQA